MLDKYFPQEQLVSVKSALSKAVVYKANTPNFLGKPINAFSGLSCYIPVESEAYLAPFTVRLHGLRTQLTECYYVGNK